MNLKNKFIIPILLVVATLNTGFFNLNMFKKPAAAEGPFKIIRTRPDGSQPELYGSSSTRAFFLTDRYTPLEASRQTDGTPSGTSTIDGWVATLPMDSIFIGEAFGIHYFFAVLQLGVWRSDGTIVGTYPIIDPGNIDMQPLQIKFHSIVTGGQNLVFFTGYDPNTYAEVAVASDGTYAGTTATPLPATISYIFLEAPTGDKWTFLDSNFGSSSVDLYTFDFVTRTFSGVVKSIANRDDGRGSSYSNGTKLFFPVHEWGVGNTMWATDGTAAGTVELAPTVMMDSTIEHVGTAASGKEIFIAQPTAPGYTFRFYVSDGASVGDWTEVGNTGLDFRTKYWEIDSISQIGSKAIVRFDAYGETSTAASCPMWQSDGTPGGTNLVASVAINKASYADEGSFFAPLVFNGSLYFQGYTAAAGTELWKYDGITSPAIFKDLDSAATDSIKPLDGRTIYVSSNTPLISTPTYFLFQGSASASGSEYYRSDGTPAGTYLLKDIFPGSGSSVVHFNGKPIGSKIVFAAADDVHGEELWVTDGTTVGTTLVGTFNQNPGDSKISYFTQVGSQLYFTARDNDHGIEPWVTDGTVSGTTLVKDVVAGDGNSYPGGFSSTSNGVVFYAQDDSVISDYESVYVTNGTPAGTSKISSTNSANGSNAVTLSGFSYFVGFDGSGQELWKTDGTSGGTTVLKDISAGAASSFDWSVDWIEVFNSFIFFAPTKANNTFFTDPWVTDGTSGGTQLLKQIFPDPYGGSYPEGGVKLGSSFIFTASDVDGDRELYITDGTPASTTKITDINSTGDADALLFDSINGKVVFTANDGTNGNELWATDGTSGGTVMIKDFSLGALSSTFRVGSAKDANFIYFIVQPDSQNWQLWKTDGTTSGTTLIYTFAATDAPTSYDTDFVSAGSYIFFTFCTNANGCEIWRSDKTGPGTRMYWDANPGNTSTEPYSLVYFQGKIFFVGNYSNSKVIWATGLTSH